MASGRDRQPASGWKRFGRVVGAVLSAACVLYIGLELKDSKEEVFSAVKSPQVLRAVGVSSALWILLNALLGIGWMALLRAMGNRILLYDALKVTLGSQAGKYLPGNVFHVAGRIWLAGRRGIGRKPAAIATVGEMGFLVVMALFIGLPWLLSRFSGSWIAPAFVLMLVGALVFVAVYRKLDSEFLNTRILSHRGRLAAWLSLAVGAYFSIFTVQFVMFEVIASAQLLELGMNPVERFRMVTVTWLAGFVVIGSPGGLGVREAAFALFAQSEGTQAQLLLAASLMRIASIIGDFASLGIGFLMRSMND